MDGNVLTGSHHWKKLKYEMENETLIYICDLQTSNKARSLIARVNGVGREEHVWARDVEEVVSREAFSLFCSGMNLELGGQRRSK